MIYRIYVEGEMDRAFIRHLLHSLFGITFPDIPSDPLMLEKERLKLPLETTVNIKSKKFTFQLFSLGGFDRIKSLGRAIFMDKIGHGLQTIFILDADTTNNTNVKSTGGHKKRLAHLNKTISNIIKKLDPSTSKTEEPKIFLFPDNINDGTIENLLENMITKEGMNFSSICWETFKTSLSLEAYNSPPLKSKIYAYAGAMNISCLNFNGLNNSFSKTKNVWDWDSKALENLITFLTQVMPT